jgi:penicillin-binding protein 1C
MPPRLQNHARILLTSCVVASVALVAVVLAVKPPPLDAIGFSRAVYDRRGQLLRLTVSADQKYRLFTPLQDISPRFREATLLHEDRHFYRHVGVDPLALMRGFLRTYIVGGRKIGASTISMQLARMVYGVNSRSLSGKCLQILHALQLEAHYSKDQLFEAYLNRASYGYNIEGVGAASAIYFHAKAQDLTLPEALTLAVVPQSPKRRRPERAKPAKPSLIEARNRLFGRWLGAHPDDSAQRPFFALPLSTYGVADLPFEAPHLAQDLLSKYPDRQRIIASIDLDTQQELTRILRKYVDDRRENGISNASALLVDTQTMGVVASMGSADFKDRAIHGQVDGTRARRSPGSTLKPFVYALALDQGLIHPLSILGDAPVNFGSYAPDNFDRDFRGPISARDALRMSRNIPAIKLAARLHGPDLYDLLKDAGIAGLRDKSSYGLSLVLGGAEVTARELAMLYAALANDGELRPLVYQTSDSLPESRKRLFSPEASFMTLDMLADRPRINTVAQDRIVYWKTGTSNGFHDAWTAGVFGHYALVVWIGAFDGANNPSLVGVRAAAPLFFAMADAINGKEQNRERIAGKARHLRLRKIKVCATTGDLSLDDCPARADTWFMPGVSPIRNHDVYRKILVDLRTGERACHVQPGVTEYRAYEVWPSDLRQTLERAGIAKTALPAWRQDCLATTASVAGGEDQKPSITSPQSNVEYRVRMEDGNEAVPLSAKADGEVRSLHWFANNQYLGSSKSGETMSWRARPGQYLLRVVDDQGRSDMTRLQVVLTQ